MNEHKEKELVTLREKPMKNGGSSLYLDYSLNGVRVKEYLKMYLAPETSKIAKLQNVETLKAATQLKAKKIIEIQNGEAGIKEKKKDILFIDFLEQQRQSYSDQGKTEYSNNIQKIIRWLELYNRKAILRHVDKDYILDFFAFCRKGLPAKKKKEIVAAYWNKPKKGVRRVNLGDGLSEGTIYQYYSTLGTLFNNAVRAHLLPANPLKEMMPYERPKCPETNREYLTLDELKKLMSLKVVNEEVRDAFMFACFTGLRVGDMERLTWDMIRTTATSREVATRQGKTHKLVYVPLTENAESFLPECRTSGKVWDLPGRDDINDCLQRWAKKAGIKKHISFHCARHTYATLLLTYGADLYTVSKLLGHSNVRATQIYAKIIDKKKAEAVNLIPKL